MPYENALPAPPTASSTPARATFRPPPFVRCFATLTLMRAALKLLGFHRTMNGLRRSMLNVAIDPDFSREHVMEISDALALAAAFYPGRAKCLERSLTLYYLARREGAGVHYRQGVQTCPFVGHAWVEYQGEVINDVEEHIKTFSRLPDQLP